MAKGKMALKTPGLKGQLKTIDTLGRQMGKERKGDFAVSLSALNAGRGNLARQLGRYERGLGVTNKVVNRSLGRLTKKAREVQRDVRRAEAGIGQKYGTGMSDYADTVFAPARVGARTSGRLQERIMNQGSVATRIGKDTMAVAREGAAAQGEAAEYMLAQALQQRTIIDNQTLAQLTGQAYQTAIEFNNQKKMMEFEAKMAEKAATGSIDPASARALATVVPEVAADAVTRLRGAMNNPEAPAALTDKDGNVIGVDISTLTARWAAENGYDPEVNKGEIMLFMETARGIKRGMSPQTAAQQAVNVVYGNMKGFEKWGTHLLNAVGPGYYVARTSQKAAEGDLAPDSDTPMFSNTLTPEQQQAQEEGGLFFSGPAEAVLDTGLVGYFARGMKSLEDWRRDQAEMKRLQALLPQAKTKEEAQKIIDQIKDLL